MEGQGNSRGIVIFASGSTYVAHAIAAAHRSQRFNDVAHLLFVSEPPPTTEIPVQVFAPTPNVWMDRIACYLQSPFARTIFLDADCHVLGPLGELFDILDHYEIAAAHAPGYRGLADPEIPEAFYEFNCGVLAVAMSERTRTLFRVWRETYREWRTSPPFPGANSMQDQPPFRRAVWSLGISAYVLAPEYNWRPAFSSFLKKPPKILHGYHAAPEQVARRAAELGYGAMPALIPHLTDILAAEGPIVTDAPNPP